GDIELDRDRARRRLRPGDRPTPTEDVELSRHCLGRVGQHHRHAHSEERSYRHRPRRRARPATLTSHIDVAARRDTPLLTHASDRTIVNYSVHYDSEAHVTPGQAIDETFAALGDPTRAAILRRLSRGPASVTELAESFAMSLRGVLKHVQVLE